MAILDNNILDRLFDDLLFQTQRGKITHNQLEKGIFIRYDQFEKVEKWKSKYGYKFNIYGNDHFINGKAHFHFDNHEANIFCKIDFEGNILELKGKNEIPSKIYEELSYFLLKESNQRIIKEMWNNKNPNLLV